LSERKYTSFDRSWSEEIIYFLMVDRFHDGKNRTVVTYDKNINGFPDDCNSEKLLKQRFGGTFKGVQSQLTYIKKLGCTTIWLSPVFENYQESYHGYAICNFLNTDPHFGSIEELKELVEAAHQQEIRVVLDIVINHTADTWTYKEGEPPYTGKAYAFGEWKYDKFPIPTDFRNPDIYKKSGAIQNWDEYPETREGDIFELKKLILDESSIGKEVLQAMIKIYCHWIKELDIDGYRLDTVKHLAPSTVALFCNDIKEYALYLGKKSFLLFGEAIGDDSMLIHYSKSAKTYKGRLNGMDGLLDFPLHFILNDVIKGKKKLKHLYKTFHRKEKLCKKYNKKLSDFIVFIDNHDQIAQNYKSRLGFNADEKEAIAAIGFLYFLYGIPCLYYGSEQHFQGAGNHDCFVREPMFDVKKQQCFHNENSFLMNEISLLAKESKNRLVFKDAKLSIDNISVNGGSFSRVDLQNEIIYWSKCLFSDKLILLYNLDKTKSKIVLVQLTKEWARNTTKNQFKYVYGETGDIEITTENENWYIKLDLLPNQFVIMEYRA